MVVAVSVPVGKRRLGEFPDCVFASSVQTSRDLGETFLFAYPLQLAGEHPVTSLLPYGVRSGGTLRLAKAQQDGGLPAASVL